MTEKTEAQKIAEAMSDFVNSYTIPEDEFIAAMELEHRTLQQSFTRLCLKWLQHCASIDYRYDDRNQGAHATSKALIELFKQQRGMDPSEYLPFI